MKSKKYKPILHRIFSRSIITALIIIFQLVWIFILVSQISLISRYIEWIFRTLGFIMSIYIIGTGSNASAKMAWVIVIGFFPIVGVPLYFMFGDKDLGKKLRLKFEKAHSYLNKKYLYKKENIVELERWYPTISGSFKYLEGHCNYPVYKNTDISYYSSGETIYADILIELKKAKKHIYLEFFIINEGLMWTSIISILKEKAAAGVDVRLIYDDVGCIDRLPANFPSRMAEHGIKTVAFNRFVPFISAVMNHRDHRKIIVIDSLIAYTGGMNIADEYINEYKRFGHWKDSGIKLVGDGAYGLSLLFLEMWNTLVKVYDDLDEIVMPEYSSSRINRYDSYVQPFADSPLNFEEISENLYLNILGGAGRYVYIFTPYLVVDSSMTKAICRAAKRGVDVRIVTPAIPDKYLVHRLTRSNYLPLIQGGVKVYEYSPGFIHAKNVISDDLLGVVGTINLDFRSLNLHFECGVLLHDNVTIKEMKKDFLDTLKSCKQITIEDCRTNFIGILGDAILRLFAPLM